MALSGYRGTVKELNALSVNIQSGKGSLNNLMAKFAFISFNHYGLDPSLNGKEALTHFGYSNNGVKYLFNGSLQESEYVKIDPVGTNNNRHIVLEGENFSVAYDIHDTLD